MTIIREIRFLAGDRTFRHDKTRYLRPGNVLHFRNAQLIVHYLGSLGHVLFSNSPHPSCRSVYPVEPPAHHIPHPFPTVNSRRVCSFKQWLFKCDCKGAWSFGQEYRKMSAVVQPINTKADAENFNGESSTKYLACTRQFVLTPHSTCKVSLDVGLQQ